MIKLKICCSGIIQEVRPKRSIWFSFSTINQAFLQHWYLAIAVLATHLGCLPPFTVAGKKLPPSHLCLHCSSLLFTLHSSAWAHHAPSSCSILESSITPCCQTAFSDSSGCYNDDRLHCHCCYKAHSPFIVRVPSDQLAMATDRLSSNHYFIIIIIIDKFSFWSVVRGELGRQFSGGLTKQ